MQITYIPMPIKVTEYLTCKTKYLAALGNLTLLDHYLLAAFGSMKSPPETTRAGKYLPGSIPDMISVISGFHSPLEVEWYQQLRQKNAGLILVPARSLDTLIIRADWKSLLADGRMLLISPFTTGCNWRTRESALERNRFIAALADAVLILHAAPGSSTEVLAKECLAHNKPVYTLSPDHTCLLAAGARPVEPELLQTISWK